MKKMLSLIFVLAFTVIAVAQQQTQSQWNYTSNQSVHGTHKAIDTTLLGGVFPAQRPMLMFRNHAVSGYGVAMGFTTFTFAGDPSILVKFDNDAPDSYQANYYNNFMDMILVQEDGLRFIERAKRAKQVVIEHNIFNVGKFSFVFDLRKLNLNKLQ